MFYYSHCIYFDHIKESAKIFLTLSFLLLLVYFFI